MSPQESEIEVRTDNQSLPTVTTGQPHLARQDLACLDISKLTPLSPGKNIFFT